MEAARWTKLLGSWTEQKGPLHRRLSTGIRTSIQHGLALHGTRLPSERDLALALRISRNTVVAAYNALRDEGWLESKTGNGTWVRRESGLVRDAQEEARIEHIAQNSLLSVLDLGETSIDFATGTPYPLKGFPAEALALTPEENERLLNTRHYYPFGLPALRQAIAAHYTNSGLDTSPDDILVTSGAQQAIMLTGSLFLQRGDPVLIEDPCYFGALEAFRTLGARPHTLPVGDAGVEPQTFRDALTAATPRLAYLTPTFQNPTGTVMPAIARREIVQAASQRGIPLIDDRTLADISLEQVPERGLAVYDTTGTTLTIGSLGKLMWAGLRIGWIRAARHLVERLVRLKMANDLGTALPTQALAVKLLALHPEAKALRRRELSAKRDLMVSLLREQLPDWSFSVPCGGLFLWVELPRGNSSELAQVAMRHRLVLLPGSNMSADHRHSNMLRLPFLLEENELREGVRRLVVAWRDYTSGNRRAFLQTLT
jgi:DNA-binding transcriptional MocR family regulator